MASPQTEEGFTRISNELLLAMSRHKMSGGEWRVFLFCLRYTYGFNRKGAEMSLSFIAKGIGMDAKNVNRELQKLTSKRTVLRHESLVTINKNYDEWGPSKQRGGRLIGVKVPSKQTVEAPSNPTYKKENTLKKTKKERGESALAHARPTPSPVEIARRFFTNPVEKERVISLLIGKGIPEGVVKQEVAAFVSYWCEKNKSGTRSRWELERTFEVNLRLATWFRNMQKFNREKLIKRVRIS